MEAIKDLGNPFADDSTDLVTLDTKVTTIQTAEQLGSTQYQSFIDERMSASTKSLYDPIHKNNLPLFKSGKTKTTKSSMKTVAMKTGVQLFPRMYIDSFFEHENHPWPPSLAENNSKRQGSKADLMGCLEALARRPEYTSEVDMEIIDGAALMYTLDPKKSNVTVKTFGDFS